MSTLKNKDNRVEDPKRARVLEGAMQVFLAYGFSRATMDDIARAVDISRPALYLLFRNKADIFRAVGQDLLARSRVNACQALREDGTLEQRLMEALDRALFQLFRMVEGSPHGDELVDLNNHVAADMVAEWRQGMVDCFARAIREEALRRGATLEERGLSAQALAEMLFNILEGLKASGRCGSAAEDNARQFVSLIELALEK
ncbi:helix-turn-helix domain-containing protein [Chelativorans sp.]|uniref:TetR/AcrR family transcriptional regulator n=1 Tax=Chelativorans sp. TaxID=2203393 RepID=UPI002810FC8F|nr:helix-turn-helix domain-containing protein [Chelativorans sp.]